MVRYNVADTNHFSDPKITNEAELERVFDELKAWNEILKDTSVSDQSTHLNTQSSNVEGGRHGA